MEVVDGLVLFGEAGERALHSVRYGYCLSFLECLWQGLMVGHPGGLFLNSIFFWVCHETIFEPTELVAVKYHQWVLIQLCGCSARA